MPTLNWIGKDAVVNHHLKVPFRLLKDVPDLACGDSGSGNLIVQGDNLEALKALLPYYAGQVKCIYIDPPYNTGNEGWAYNDNVNSPVIRDWLGKVVGKEGETLDRHDRWLCMMYPRLALLRQFLREDGSIWISMDDNELPVLRLVLDEIFGVQNFVVQVEWQKRYTRSNNTVGFTTVVEHIVVYRKSDAFVPNLEQKGEEADARYKNPDNDLRGAWKAIPFLNPLSPRERPNLCYDIIQPNTGKILKNTAKAWRTSKDTFDKYVEEDRVWWGRDGKADTPNIKRFLSEVRRGMPPINFWGHEVAGHTDMANSEIKELFGEKIFDTPKPTQLIQRIFEHATNPGDLVLDSFAGSGTTGHAVLKMNAAKAAGTVGKVDAASSPGEEVDVASSPRFSEMSLFDAARGGDAASTGDGADALDKRGGDAASTGGGADALNKRGGDAASTGDGAGTLDKRGGDAASTGDGADALDKRGEDAASTGDVASTFAFKTYFDPRQPIGFLRGGNLPHWRQQGATYFVTWRTADSMPAERVQQWLSEREAWLEQHPEPRDVATQAEYDRRFPARWERWLDEGYGACELRCPEIRALMETALRHFDGDRYRLDEAVIMPNHVHVLVTPLGDHTLSKIVQNWKSFTAHAINEQLGRKGSFWQKENFDHIVRNADEMSRFRAYVNAQKGEVDAGAIEKRGGDAASTGDGADALDKRGGDAASTGDGEGAKPRRFILVEMEPEIAKAVTAERVRRVAEGYTNAKGKAVEGLGGGFRFCELGDALFDRMGMIRETVKFSELARHVFFSETGEPVPRARVMNTPLIGEYNGVGIYLLYNGILGDESVDGGNVLTRQVLAQLPPFDGPKVIYCASCLLSRDRLQAERITIRQTPYEIKVS